MRTTTTTTTMTMTTTVGTVGTVGTTSPPMTSPPTTPSSERSTRARRLRRLALVLPFLLGPLAVRLAFGPVGDSLAAGALALAPSTAVSASAPTEEEANDPNDEQPVTPRMSARALTAGATRLTGRIVRGDETWTVVLELPLSRAEASLLGWR
jgi:hypothetical protein